MIAPVLVQVYNRKEHFINCIESLAQCRLANQTHLFITSDAPKSDKDKALVEEIRNYCANITGFKKVDIIAPEKNLGVVEIGNKAVERIFSEYDTLIWSEDDNIFSQNFLEFINGGLEFYKDNPNVFAICGYKHYFNLPHKYPNDIFASVYIAAWGFGIWKEKYQNVNFYPTEIDISTNGKKQMSNLWYRLMIDTISNNKAYGDVLMTYHCLKHNLINIFPVMSLVQNHGNDGSGEHCAVIPGYSYQEICIGHKVFKFIDTITARSDIHKKITNAVDYPFMSSYERMKKKGMKITRQIKKHIKKIIKLR